MAPRRPKNKPVFLDIEAIDENGYPIMFYGSDDPYYQYRYGREAGTRWVDPSSRRTKQDYPYSYSEFFISGSRRDIDAAQAEYEKIKGSRTDVYFGAEYSDRIDQWNYRRSRYEWQQHCSGCRWDNAGSGRIEAFLAAFHNLKSVTLHALAEGCNSSNGYPYWIVWYTGEQYPEEEKKAREAVRKEEEAGWAYAEKLSSILSSIRSAISSAQYAARNTYFLDSWDVDTSMKDRLKILADVDLDSNSSEEMTVVVAQDASELFLNIHAALVETSLHTATTFLEKMNYLDKKLGLLTKFRNGEEVDPYA